MRVLRHLPKGARQFVDALAVAGRPINPEVAYQAAGLSGDELPLVSSLRAAQFLRTGGSGHTLELYHDRIRETLAPNSDRKRVTQIHRVWPRRSKRAASTIRKHSLNTIWARGSECGRPRMPEWQRRKRCALAFDRAAAFYRRALELAPARGAN